MTETMYTLDQARPLIALQDCESRGHNITCTDMTPAVVVCARCGTAWTLGTPIPPASETSEYSSSTAPR